MREIVRAAAAIAVILALASPASAFCGSMNKHPQPNWATKSCKPL